MTSPPMLARDPGAASPQRQAFSAPPPPLSPRPQLQLLRASNDDNASYAAWLPATRELFFAGTHTWRQLALDLSVAPVDLGWGEEARALPPSACARGLRVHSGFALAYAAIQQQVRRAVGEGLAAGGPNASLRLYGFSLGAAVAPLAAADLVCAGLAPPSRVQLFTMGGPGICR